jgi:hypothetical protein
LKTNNSYSILLALPSEVYLSENMPINIWVKRSPWLVPAF